jgi:hypothetical protein
MHLVSEERELVFPGTTNVIQVLAKTGHLQNGIKYCIVQVIFNNSEEYRIDAYGEEADDLYIRAMEKSAVLCQH